MERLILAPVIVLIVGISDLVYGGIVGPEGFYVGAFRQGLAVEI